MRRKPNYDHESASMLASAGVLSLGFLGVMFVIAASFSDPLVPLVLSAGLFAALFCGFLLSLRAPNAGEQGGLRSWFKSRRTEEPVDYSPRRVKTSRNSSTDGNEPPSADDVRDMKETSPNAWVPTSVPRDSRR